MRLSCREHCKVYGRTGKVLQQDHLGCDRRRLVAQSELPLYARDPHSRARARVRRQVRFKIGFAFYEVCSVHQPRRSYEGPFRQAL